MRIAVIIPVYNHARYIGETLQSVLDQTRKADRILCIDDGSKDDSLAVVKTFESKGVQSFGRENRGAHNTINELVAWAAKEGCDWINILNSDDRFLPRRLEACAALAEASPAKQVICGRLEVIDDQDQVMAADVARARWFYGVQSLTDPGTNNVSELLGRANFIATTTNVFARTDYLLANPFRPYRFNHDYFFLTGAAWRDLLAIVPECLIQYRVHGSNTIATKPEPLIREMLRMHLDLFHHHAAELASDPNMRVRFGDYCRALWDNLSSFHAPLFHVAVAQLAAEVPETGIEAIVNALQGPEFDVFPNNTLAGSFDGTPLPSLSALGQKLDALKGEKAKWAAERDAWNELLPLKQQLLESRWIALGAALGFGRSLLKNDGKGPVEKLQKLREACAKSGWMKLGRMMGSRTARASHKSSS